MSEQTNIPWCDSTDNFWSGCSKISPGCLHCYAAAHDSRQLQEKVCHWGPGAPRLKGKGAVKTALRIHKLPWICDKCGTAYGFGGQSAAPACIPCLKPLRRRRVFSLSLGDWLDPEVPFKWRAQMLNTIRITPNMDWILCTKRPELFRERIDAAAGCKLDRTQDPRRLFLDWCLKWIAGTYTPPNVWILWSAENQEQLEKRTPHGLAIPAVVHGISAEPLLGPLRIYNVCGLSFNRNPDHSLRSDSAGVDWVIVGGESGPKARPCDVGWIRHIKYQCEAASVPCFVKQLGSSPYETDLAPCGGDLYSVTTAKLALNHPKGGDPSEWPEDLRVRQFPTPTA